MKTISVALLSRVRGCWLGKSIGGTLGLPAEGKTQRLNFSFYDPVPTIAPPNDDLELQLVWLDLVEKSGGTLTTADFAAAWIDHIHYMWDEYGRCRWNLRRGVPLGSVGVFENPFHAGMGSPIRSEIWACLFPGDVGSAAHYAATDAALDHGLEGIAGEVFFAAMQSAVLGEGGLKEAIELALAYIPEECETAKAIGFVRRKYRAGTGEWECREQLLKEHGNENFTHTPLNVALTLWALYYGEEDFEKSILLAVNGGYDTDCTAATVGATLGLLHGVEKIPEKWSRPIGEGVYIGPGILDISAPATLEELTQRTLAWVGKLQPEKWNPAAWNRTVFQVDLTSLPGTISISPLGNDISLPWANGELPRTVKEAGGGSWIWQADGGEAREIYCLARQGAKLFLDDEKIFECPPGLPYIPATHRSPSPSSVRVHPAKGSHRVRIELNANSPDQEASVILAYPNRHLCPWTKDELPHPARLPG